MGIFLGDRLHRWNCRSPANPTVTGALSSKPHAWSKYGGGHVATGNENLWP